MSMRNAKDHTESEDENMTLGERIQSLRKEKGYTQEKLALHLNLSRQAVAKWEQNVCEPNLDSLVAMAELFEVDLNYLITGKNAGKNAGKTAALNPEPPPVEVPAPAPAAPRPSGKEAGTAQAAPKKKPIGIILLSLLGALAVLCQLLSPWVGVVMGISWYQQIEAEKEGSEGLTFTKRSDGTYRVGAGNCSDTHVVIPRRGPDGNLVTVVSDFDGQTQMESIIIPDSVTLIGYKAFRGCTSLSSITLPDSITAIGKRAFMGCVSLKSIHIPRGMTTISQYTFEGMSGLESVTIPEGVTTIEFYAFSECPNLREVKISSTVTSIDRFAFGSPTTIGKITVDESNPVYSSRGNCLIETKSKILVMAGREFTIPDDGSVTAIGVSAFLGRKDITSITIPAGVKSIGVTAFRGCTNLTSVTLPNTLAGIGNYAFSDCTSLTSVTIPDSVTRLGQYVFSKCAGLTTATISAGLTSIDRCVFEDCVNLESLTIPGSVTSVERTAIMGCDKLRHIYFSGTTDQWKAIRKEMNDYYWKYTVYCADGELGPW